MKHSDSKDIVKIAINIDQGVIWEVLTDVPDRTIKKIEVYSINVDIQTVRKLQVRYGEAEEISLLAEFAEIIHPTEVAARTREKARRDEKDGERKPDGEIKGDGEMKPERVSKYK